MIPINNKGAFTQKKKLSDYIAKIDQGQFSIFKGHQLSKMDLIIRQHILELMCNLETTLSFEIDVPTKENILYRLKEMNIDGLVEIKHYKIIVKEKGRIFIRNICTAFDLKLLNNKPSTRIFSMTI